LDKCLCVSVKVKVKSYQMPCQKMAWALTAAAAGPPSSRALTGFQITDGAPCLGYITPGAGVLPDPVPKGGEGGNGHQSQDKPIRYQGRKREREGKIFLGKRRDEDPFFL